jgi:hypothetical protein
MKKIFYLLIIVIVQFGCSDNKDNSPQYVPDENLNIHIVGNGNNGILWYKNVPTFSTANIIYYSGFLNGLDVYIAGTVSTEGTYWKNGIPTTLSKPVGGIDSSADTIFVTGSDVYVGGWVGFTTNNYTPVLWKNNVPTILANSGGSADSVFVSGSDVYVAGHTYTNSNTKTTAILWKNGVPITLATWGNASSVFVSGSNVFVVYQDHNANIGKLWKNGVSTSLASPPYYYTPVGSDIYVNGSDVYISGYAYPSPTSSNPVPVLWKNNVPTILANGGVAHCVYVSGSDVYVGGVEYISGTKIGKIWKNGVGTTLPSDSDIYAEPRDIFK